MNNIIKSINRVEGWLENENIKNQYSHMNIFSPKEFKVDCSEFVFNILQKANKIEALDEISTYIEEKDDKQERLWASSFLKFFNAIQDNKIQPKNWKLNKLENAKEGNLFVYEKETPERIYYQHHIMIIKNIINNEEIEVAHSSDFGVSIDILKLKKENGDYKLYYPSRYNKTILIRDFKIAEVL
jgi:hypothetical protein